MELSIFLFNSFPSENGHNSTPRINPVSPTKCPPAHLIPMRAPAPSYSPLLFNTGVTLAYCPRLSLISRLMDQPNTGATGAAGTPATTDTGEIPRTGKRGRPRTREPKPIRDNRSTLEQIDSALKLSTSDDLQAVSDLIGGTVNDPSRSKGQLPLTPELQQNNVLTHLAVITLSKAGMSHTMISAQTGISHQAIGVILENPRLQFLHSGRSDVYRKALPMLLLELATASIVSIRPEELQALNPLQRVTLSAIAIDKARLLLGESTQNIAVREYVPQLQDQMQELLVQRDQILALVQSRYGVDVSNKLQNEQLSLENKLPDIAP